MKRSLSRAVLAAALLFGWNVSTAATTSFSNEAAFISATGATNATGALPLDEGPLTSKVVGSITFSIGAGSTGLHFGTTHVLYPGGWSSLLSGHDLAISGTENFNIVASGPVFAMGFRAHESSIVIGGGSRTDSCGLPACIDSTFTITALNGITPVATPFVVNFTDDTAAFFGVRSTVAFDRLVISETAGGIDDEYFGVVFTSTLAPVPEPSTWAMLAIGLGLLVFQQRRRSHRAAA